MILLSRSFGYGGDNLVPVLDLLQHNANPNVYHDVISVTLENDPSNLHDNNRDGSGITRTQSVEVRARFDLDSGVELLNCYQTAIDDYQLFTRFGFIPDFDGDIFELLRSKDYRFFN